MGFFRRFWSFFRVFLRSISFGRWIVLFFILRGLDNFEEVLDRFVIDCAAVFYFFAFFDVFLKLVGRRSFCKFSVMIGFFSVFSENWVRKNSIWSPLLNSARRIGFFCRFFSVFANLGEELVFIEFGNDREKLVNFWISVFSGQPECFGSIFGSIFL